MQPATAPYILRAMYKDDDIVSTHLVEPISEAVTTVCGARFSNLHDAAISDICRAAYTYLSMCKQRSTLGEEFTQILPVSHDLRGNTKPLSHTRLVRLAILIGLQRTILFHFAIRWFPSLAVDDVTANIQKIVRALFYLGDTYGTLSHRVLGISYIGLKPSRSVEAGEGRSGAYFFLGLLVAAELVVRLWRHLEMQRAERNATIQRLREEQRLEMHRSGEPTDTAARTAATDIQSDNLAQRDEDNDGDDDEDPEYSTTGKCTLCLNKRKVPTVTGCGHVFCWQCVTEWIVADVDHALCPLCRQSISLQTLVPLFNFKAQPPRTIGTSAD